MSDPGAHRPVQHVLIDTNVVSYWVRNDSRGQPYLAAYASMRGHLAFQSVAELLRWSVEKNWSERRHIELWNTLRSFDLEPFTWPMADRWAEIVAGRNRTGRPMSTADAWIAATAVELGVPLMTHNRRDFDGIPGMELISFG